MENKETVLVTGGSGFIASHCIIQLAAAGYHVKATVRDLSRTNKLNQTLLNAWKNMKVNQIFRLIGKSLIYLLMKVGMKPWQDAIMFYT